MGVAGGSVAVMAGVSELRIARVGGLRGFWCWLFWVLV